MTGRAVPEWIGKTPDTPVPARVKLRVFERFAGRCHISGRKITIADQWECDHVVAIINGGQNRESNLAPALKDKHREKTDQDVALKSKTTRQREKHLGIWPKPIRKLQGRGFGPSRKAPTNTSTQVERG